MLADDETVATALTLLDAAKKWRSLYERERPDPDVDIYAYDLCRTSFGDDAFDILLDFTEASEWSSSAEPDTGSQSLPPPSSSSPG